MRLALIIATVLRCSSAFAQEPESVGLPIQNAGETHAAHEPLVRVIVVGEAPRRPTLLLPLDLSLASLSAADAYTTVSGVRRGATEANPAMKAVSRNAYALIGVKAVTTATTILVTERLWKDHPRRVVWMMAAINVATGLIVWHNSRVLAEIDRQP